MISINCESLDQKLQQLGEIYGYMQNTYQDAINFGQHPNGMSPYHTLTRNTEGDTINYVGCSDCFFDLP